MEIKLYLRRDERSFKNVEKYKFLEATVTSTYCIHIEIKS